MPITDYSNYMQDGSNWFQEIMHGIDFKTLAVIGIIAVILFIAVAPLLVYMRYRKK